MNGGWDAALAAFLQQHELTPDYLRDLAPVCAPLVEQLAQAARKRPTVLGISGCQGCGKSTLAEYLQLRLQHGYELCVVCLSLDDFYLSHAARQRLAAEVHPLLATRGVPGTHDVRLAMDALVALKASGEVLLPRFDKTADDPMSRSQWQRVQAPVDVVIFEGWCLGAKPQPAAAVAEPCNRLEAGEDTDARWRRYVNVRLAGEYQRLFRQVDVWLMLLAPSFAVVRDWRVQAERQLRRRHPQAPGLLDDEAVARFVQHYQRLTEWMLNEQPARMQHVWQLDTARRIVNVRRQA